MILSLASLRGGMRAGAGLGAARARVGAVPHRISLCIACVDPRAHGTRRHTPCATLPAPLRRPPAISHAARAVAGASGSRGQQLAPRGGPRLCSSRFLCGSCCCCCSEHERTQQPGPRHPGAFCAPVRGLSGWRWRWRWRVGCGRGTRFAPPRPCGRGTRCAPLHARPAAKPALRAQPRVLPRNRCACHPAH